MVAVGVVKSKVKNHPKFVAGCLLIVIIAAGALIYAHNRGSAASATQETEQSNKAFVKGNKALALEHAKKALAKDPNNIDNILLVANLSKTQDPAATKKYYAQALAKFKQQNNPDAPGKSAVVYWAAAEMARQAGETTQAKQYYKQVIQTANPSDSYQKSLSDQSQAELGGLQ